MVGAMAALAAESQVAKALFAMCVCVFQCWLKFLLCHSLIPLSASPLDPG